jgi:hypothetical protein
MQGDVGHMVTIVRITSSHFHKGGVSFGVTLTHRRICSLENRDRRTGHQ